jgi:hypothetical protein
MWMPIMLFFFMGFEHSIVNMFLFPSGLLLGGDFTIMDYLVWNEIPTVIGNLVGGLVFTAIPLYLTHARTTVPRTPTSRRTRRSRAQSADGYVRSTPAQGRDVEPERQEAGSV